MSTNPPKIRSAAILKWTACFKFLKRTAASSPGILQICHPFAIRRQVSLYLPLWHRRWDGSCWIWIPMLALTHWVWFLFFLKRTSRLAVVFRRLLHLGNFPICWRRTNVTPIPKCPPSSSVANYKPISNLPVKNYRRGTMIYRRSWPIEVNKRQTIVGDYSPWVGRQSLPAVGDIYADYSKLDNNKNSIILSMNNFSLETFIYAIKWPHWEKNVGLTLPVESSVYRVNLPM